MKQKKKSENIAHKDKSEKKLRSQATREFAQSASPHTEAMLVEAQRIFHVGSWDWDLAMDTIQFSEGMYRLVGLLPGEIIVTRDVFAKFLPPDEAQQILHEFQYNTSRPFSSIEHRIVLPNGEIRIAHTRIKAYKDEHGNPLRLLGSTQDITERKRTEEALKESEWRNRIVSELITDYIFVVDVNPNGTLKLRWASENMFRITGRIIADTGTSDLWGNIIHPDDAVRFFGFINQILSSAEAGELECRTLHKQGKERWVRIFARPQTNEENRVTVIVGAIQDITERKLSEVALQKLNEQLLAQLNEIKELHIILHDQAIHDSLTGLYNRRYMQEAVAQEYARAMREGYPISIIVLDLDHLKEINIKYGHFTGGDVALQVLGEHLKAMTRAEDIACRHGGDEFLIALHNTSVQVAQERAEQWRKSLVQANIESNGMKFNISFSAGIAAFPTNGQDIEEVMQAADKALYRAKGMGRNCVMIHSE